MKSFYETLEVSPCASPVVIRAAYRSLAQHYHPDKNPDDADAGQRLMGINRAYAVLSDPEKRQAYDQQQGSAQGFAERRGHGDHLPAQREARGEGPATSRPFAFRPLD